MARKEISNVERNHRFAEALDYLKREGRVRTQQEFAAMIGVNKDTITNILHLYTPVTEDVISKLQAATNGVFCLQWLRGVCDVMLSKDVKPAVPDYQKLPADGLDVSSVINTIVAAKDGQIASLEREIESKNKLIASMERELALLRSKEKNPGSWQEDEFNGFTGEDDCFPMGVADR